MDWSWEYAESTILDATELFHIWTGQPELLWAERAWHGILQQYVDEQGEFYELPDDDDAEEIADAWMLVRLLTLGVIYHEFCYLAWEESSAFPLDTLRSIWEGAFGKGIDRELMVRMASELDSEASEGGHEEKNKDELFEDAVARLVEISRGEVFRALCDKFGGIQGVFAYLCTSDSRDLVVLSEKEIKHKVFGAGGDETGMGPAYEFVSEGFRF